MNAMIQGFLLSLSFSLLTALVATGLALGVILIRSHALDSYLQVGLWKKLRQIPDVLASVCESIPLLILLILLGQTGLSDAGSYLLYLVKAALLGIFMFPSVWRYLDNRLDLETEEVYPVQLVLWKISSIKVAFSYVLGKYLNGIISSVLWVFNTALTLDLSIGFLKGFGVSGSIINWYDAALGNMLGESLNDGFSGTAVAVLLLILAMIILLYQLAQKLNPSPVRIYNRIKEELRSGMEADFEFSGIQLKPGALEIRNDPQSKLSLKEGEFVWLNGPSGSGKSLFIKAIMQMLHDSDESGLISPERIPVIHYRQQKLSEATVIMPQEPDLYIFPYLAVEDYLACMIGETIEQLYERCATFQGDYREYLLRLIDTVSKIRKTQVRSLSAGEKRMVAFVVAISQSLAENSRLVIFDEPDSSLDQNGIKALRFYLSRINHCSVIYVTHNVMHSRDLYDTLDKMGIWQLRQAPDSPQTQLISKVQDVPAHYQAIHSQIADTLARIKNQTAANPRAASGGAQLLEVKFPLTIKIGGGLKLGLRQNGQKLDSLRVFPDSGIIGLVGDNGIGKSSLLRAVLGIYETREDRIILGSSTRGSSAQSTQAVVYKHKFTYVFDDVEKALPEHLPLSRVLNDLKAVYPHKFSETRYVSQFSPEQLRRPLAKFSGGERQKIIFDLICHMLEAKLILLDEPFSRLDWGNNLIEVCTWLMERAQSCPMIIISHNHEILNALAPDSTYEIYRVDEGKTGANPYSEE